MKVYIFTFCMLLNLAHSWTPTGIYIDNGLDQTIIERAVTKAEKREMETEILHLLGLPNRPRKDVNIPLNKSAPKFLLNVYKSLMENENSRFERSTDGISFTKEEKNAIEESDVIVTFENIDSHVSNLRHERGKRLWFNVTDIMAEDIVGAELRLFQKGTSSNKKQSVYTIVAYQLINTDNGERELEFISAVNTTSDYNGWLELNLTKCFASWAYSYDTNKGIYLSVHLAEKPGHEIKPEDIGLITVKSEDEIQPFMVAFLKATNNVHVRTKRQIKSKTKRVKKSDYSSIMMRNSHVLSQEFDNKSSCRLHTLYINFKDLKWENWIIAPEGYAAYFCAGDCNFPLNSHMNATNHAIVQSLVHLMHPPKYPKPCCAPTKLNPISVLYVPNDNNVCLKKYKRMVVKSCGCL